MSRCRPSPERCARTAAANPSTPRGARFAQNGANCSTLRGGWTANTAFQVTRLPPIPTSQTNHQPTLEPRRAPSHPMPDSLTLTDNRTGRTSELPIKDGTVRAADLRKVRTGPEDFGLVSYDPALVNTAACRSRITYIDGDKGILRYRGYPIEQLAQASSYLDTAYL